MKAGIRGLDAWVAASLLAVLTLGVFLPLQNSGPESVIRRFHMASLSRDDSELQRLTLQDIRSPEVVQLRGIVYEIARAGGTFQLGRVLRKPRLVQAEVLYSVPGLGTAVSGWVVQKPAPQTRWKINAAATLSIFRQLGF